MDELLTITEAANIIGISEQAFYKRIKKGTIADYVVLKDGKYFLKPSIIEKYRTKEPATTNSTVEQPVEQKADITAFLKAQIESKDKLISELQATIREQQAHIIEQSQKLSEIIAKQNDLQSNFQILLAKQFDIKGLSTGSTTVQQPVEKVDEPVEIKEQEPQEQPKQGFFRRIFKKSLK